jgi:hypothetical protein
MGESLLFELHVGVQVDLGGICRFMAEPEGDHAQVHTTPEEIHGGRVPQSVWRYRFLCERRAGLPCGGVMPNDKSLESIGTEVRAARIGEDGIEWLASAL